MAVNTHVTLYCSVADFGSGWSLVSVNPRQTPVENSKMWDRTATKYIPMLLLVLLFVLYASLPSGKTTLSMFKSSYLQIIVIFDLFIKLKSGRFQI